MMKAKTKKAMPASQAKKVTIQVGPSGNSIPLFNETGLAGSRSTDAPVKAGTYCECTSTCKSCGRPHRARKIGFSPGWTHFEIY